MQSSEVRSTRRIEAPIIEAVDSGPQFFRPYRRIVGGGFNLDNLNLPSQEEENFALLQSLFDKDNDKKKLILGESVKILVDKNRSLSSEFFFNVEDEDKKGLFEILVQEKQYRLIIDNIEHFIKIIQNDESFKKLYEEFIKKCNINDWTDIVRNLDKFPPGSIDIYDLLEKLYDRNLTGHIVKNLDKFPEGSIDMDLLIRNLVKSKRLFLAFSYLENFLKRIDLQSFIKKLYAADAFVDIVQNLEKFPEGSIDKVALFYKLEEEGRINFLLENLEKFPTNSIDLSDFIAQLYAQGALFYIVQNLEKFPEGSIDKVALFHKLEEEGRINFLLKNLEKFPTNSIDLSDFIAQLYAQDEFIEILQNLEKFPVGSIDIDLLIKKLYAADAFVDIVQHLEKLPAVSTDMDELIMCLKKHNQLYLIFEGLNEFLRRVDVNKLIQIFFENGEFKLIVQNLEKFPAGSIDIDLLFQKLEENGEVDVILQNLEKFPEQSIDIGKYIDRLNEKDILNNILTYIEKRKTVDISDEVAEKLVPHISISQALLQHRFLHVQIWMDFYNKKGVDFSDFFEESVVKKELDILLQDGRYDNAIALRECMKMAGVPFSDAEEQQYQSHISQKEDTSNGEKRRDGEKLKKNRMIEDRIIERYTDSAIEHLCVQAEQQLQNQYPDWRLSVKAKDAFQYDTIRIDEKREKRKKEFIEWLRWYMIHAVSSELKHQKSDYKMYTVNSDTAYEFSSKEKMLDFFDAAQSSFVNDLFEERLIGGESWAKIARAGYNLWNNRDENSDPMIEYIITLQHNSGSVFSKQPVIRNPKNFQQLLDIKRNEDIENTLQKALKEDLCSAEVAEACQKRLNNAKTTIENLFSLLSLTRGK